MKNPLQYPRAASSDPANATRPSLRASSLIRIPLFLGHTELVVSGVCKMTETVSPSPSSSSPPPPSPYYSRRLPKLTLWCQKANEEEDSSSIHAMLGIAIRLHAVHHPVRGMCHRDRLRIQLVGDNLWVALALLPPSHRHPHPTTTTEISPTPEISPSLSERQTEFVSRLERSSEVTVGAIFLRDCRAAFCCR